MKTDKLNRLYFFVDESGDPYFYDRYSNYIVGKDGCSNIMILGFIKTELPDLIREKIIQLKNDINNDDYLALIPSFKKSKTAFHATDDSSEIRERVFKMIKGLPFSSEFIVARKLEKVFISRHHKRPNIFYDDLITKLFQNQLHKSKQNFIYFAVRGNRARQVPLEDAITSSVLAFEQKWKVKINSEIKIFPQTPIGEPCLQIVDYMLWAVQRMFNKTEMRYFNFIKEKISLIVDLYDFKNYPNNFYNKRNEFDIKKISPL